MKKTVLLLIFTILSCKSSFLQPKHDLHFTQLAKSWDEAIPLGNGMLGQLVWQKGDKLRFSLDRADLWDLRPVNELQQFDFKWVCEQFEKDDYKKVHVLGDEPYHKYPAPSRIPGAALEFDISGFGKIKSVDLFIDKALCVVKWETGQQLECFVHATAVIGYFKFSNVNPSFNPILKTPAYQADTNEKKKWVSGLVLLGYPKAKIKESKHKYTYIQQGWKDFLYEVNVEWQNTDNGIEGCWSIVSNYAKNSINKAETNVKNALKSGYSKSFESHCHWWQNYWSNSAITIPDKVLEKQWYLEMYKFGSASRQGAPPITLQAIWTADNGDLPPWKGDFHNDLNTQLSYWPAYTGNHLAEEQAFTDWLWAIKDRCKVFTKRYFGTNGLNIPGVCTLDGSEMGGWIQYSLSPSTSAWLAHHFYLHWKYSMDADFLKNRAYPFLKEVAVFIEEITKNKGGKRKFPLSSSPEINNNNKNAWFKEMTNYDLSLVKWELDATAEMAASLGLTEEAKHYRSLITEFPELSCNDTEGLLLAPDYPLKASHRHFSHLMSVYPLGSLDIANGKDDSILIKTSLRNLERIGSREWCGYSFAWLGSLYARAKEGQKAADSLHKFASCYCSPNSFHLNGNQCKKEYNPFTLEGNFAFAAAIMEMLIQSHNGIIEIFPAIPQAWANVSFEKLRCQGAFLISASLKNGNISKLQIISEKGGLMRLKLPGEAVIERNTKVGEVINL
jgi:alpha-L-fucosidase 2